MTAGDQAALARAPRLAASNPTPEQAAFRKVTDQIAHENRWMAIPALTPAAVPLLAEGLLPAASYAMRGADFVARGGELKFGPNFRIAPFGNRTGDPLGRWPHYHRRKPLIEGVSEKGQGLGRHRPWETKEPDSSFWDRF